jgi:hypothetical protein
MRAPECGCYGLSLAGPRADRCVLHAEAALELVQHALLEEDLRAAQPVLRRIDLPLSGPGNGLLSYKHKPQRARSGPHTAWSARMRVHASRSSMRPAQSAAVTAGLNNPTHNPGRTRAADGTEAAGRKQTVAQVELDVSLAAGKALRASAAALERPHPETSAHICTHTHTHTHTHPLADLEAGDDAVALQLVMHQPRVDAPCARQSGAQRARTHSVQSTGGPSIDSRQSSTAMAPAADGQLTHRACAGGSAQYSAQTSTLTRRASPAASAFASAHVSVTCAHMHAPLRGRRART